MSEQADAASLWAAHNVRHFRRLLYAALALFIVTEIVAFLGIVPHLRPVSLRDITANILFAIGFGCPLVLYLSSLPRWRELACVLAVGAALACGIRLIHNWIGLSDAYKPEEVAVAEVVFGLGLASLGAMAARACRNMGPARTAALVYLLPAAASLVITLEAGIFLYYIKAIRPTGYDPSAYAADAAFGCQWSFLVGRVFEDVPLLKFVSYAIYVAPPPALVFVYALQVRARRSPPVDAATVLLAVLVSGYSLYFIFPIYGPLFSFGAAFPNAPPALEPLLGTRLIVLNPNAWPNGMPSLHLASVVLAAWQARPYGVWARVTAAVFFAGTFLATLGMGEHYLIDLVVAMPLCILVYAVCMPAHAAYRAERRAAILGGLVLLAVWYALLFFGIGLLLISPVIAWGLAILSTTLVVWLERRLYRAAFGPDDAVGSPPTAPGPRGHFLLGNLLAFRRDVLGLLADSRQRFGDVVRFRLGPMVIHLVSHPEHIKQVLLTHQGRYNKDTRSSAKILGITGPGLLTSNGAAWLRQRRLMQPVFNAQRLLGYTDLISEATDRMLERWRRHAAEGRAIDVASEMSRLTCDIIARLLLGADLREDIDEIERSTTIVMEHTWRRLERIIDPPLWLPTSGNLRFRAAKRRLDAIVRRLIAERRNGPARQDLLAFLLRAREDSSDGGMTEEQVHNETLTLLLAGQETTANALSWTWYLLAQHTRCRQHVRDEVVGRLGDRAPRAEEVSSLELTARVFQESMRLYPPIWIMERRVLEDDEIGGYAIPAGSSVEVSPYITHRHPEFWESPLTFDPERFTLQRSAARPPYAYLPFGAGQRLCIGNHLALLEARVILARVLQRFFLDLPPNAMVEPLPGITLRQRQPLWMTLRLA